MQTTHDHLTRISELEAEVRKLKRVAGVPGAALAALKRRRRAAGGTPATGGDPSTGPLDEGEVDCASGIEESDTAVSEERDSGDEEDDRVLLAEFECHQCVFNPPQQPHPFLGIAAFFPNIKMARGG